MSYNDNEELEQIEDNKKCKCCEKELKLFKDGYCKSCYYLMLQDVYLLKPGVDFTTEKQKNLIIDFLNDPKIDKKVLASKYGIALRTVFFTIQKYTIKKKVIK